MILLYKGEGNLRTKCVTALRPNRRTMRSIKIVKINRDIHRRIISGLKILIL